MVEHRSYEPKVTGSNPVSRIREFGYREFGYREFGYMLWSYGDNRLTVTWFDSKQSNGSTDNREHG